MKNDTTFVRIHSGDHLGDAKMSKKGTSLRRIFFFFAIDKRFSQNERRKVDLQNVASDFSNKFSDDFTPVFFQLWKTITSP